MWARQMALVLLGLLLLPLVLHTAVRLVRYFYKFPMPQFMANAIDNPLRRRLQPVEAMPRRLGIEPGMSVLEIGAGNGSYTVSAARHLGPAGRLITIDIEPRMIARVQQKLEEAGIQNVEAKVADVFNLPFEDHCFHLVYMIAVIGEIRTPRRALEELHRLLKPGRKLAFSEILLDPDYMRASALSRLANDADFAPRERLGGFFSYTLVFERLGKERGQSSSPAGHLSERRGPA